MRHGGHHLVRPARALPPVGANPARQCGWRGGGTSAPNQQGGCFANGSGRVFDAGLTGGSAQWGVVDLALGSTVFLSVPLHERMATNPDPEVGARLVTTNWPRTIAWSMRVVVGVIMAVQMGNFG